MVLKADKDRVTTLLKDTITLLCKNGLTFKSKFSVDALIGVTLDEDEVFLVSIKELVKSDKLLAGESGLEEGSYAEESDDSATSPRKRRRRKKRKHDRAETDGDDSDNQGEASSQEGDSMDQQPDSKRLMLKVKEEQQDDDEDADIMFIKEELDDWSRVSQQNDTAQSQQAAYFSNKFPMNSPTGSQNYSALSGGSGQGQELDGGGMWNPGGTPNQSMQGQYRLLPNTSGTSQAGPGSESGQILQLIKEEDVNPGSTISKPEEHQQVSERVWVSPDPDQQHGSRKSSCPSCHKEVCNLSRHILHVHGLSEKQTKELKLQEKMTRLRKTGQKSVRKHRNCPVPKCYAYVCRVDQHLRAVHHMTMGSSAYKRYLEKANLDGT